MNFLKSLNVKELAIQHGEKAALAVCGVLVVAFSILALTAGGYDKRPADLAGQAGKLKDAIATSQFRTEIELSATDDYATKANEIKKPVTLTKYAWKQLLLNPFSEERQQRRRPEILAAVQPRVVADKATLRIREEAKPAEAAKAGVPKGAPAKAGAAAPPAPGEVARGYCLAVVTALFPSTKQRLEFQKALRAFSADQEPRYGGLAVERRTLASDGTPTAWEKIDRRTKTQPMLQRIARWEAGDGVDPEVVDPFLTMKLPFKVTSVWGSEQGHPQLPIRELPEEAAEPEEAAAAGQAEAQPPGAGDEFGPLVPTAPAPQPKPAAKLPPGVGDNAKKAAAKPARARPVAAGEPGDWLLVRWIDFEVQPGQTYQYRVAVAVQNPNFQRSQEVRDPKDATDRYLVGPKSEPTNWITVPRNSQYFLASDRQRANRSGASEAKIEVHHWDPGLGDWVAEMFDQAPGTTIGKTKEAKYIRPDTDTEEKGDIDFSTGAVLVDLAGGSSATDMYKGVPIASPPLRMLTADENGDLVEHDFESDQKDSDRAERAAYLKRLLQQSQPEKVQDRVQVIGVETEVGDPSARAKLGRTGGLMKGGPRRRSASGGNRHKDKEED